MDLIYSRRNKLHMLSFLSPSKLVEFTPEAIKIPKGRFKHNMVCGSAKSRKNYKKLGIKYQLKKVLTVPPLPQYVERYDCVNSQAVQLAYDGGNKIVKSSIEWRLKPTVKNSYIYYNQLPKQMEQYLDVVPEKQKQRLYGFRMSTKFYFYKQEFTPSLLINRKVPKFKLKTYSILKKNTWDGKELKTLSVRSKNKIAGKLQSWYFDELYKHNFDHTKVNFRMFTFTVTTPNFSHEKTYKAWANFLQRVYNVNGEKWHYLWVAELQDGKRNKEKANEYWQLAAKKGITIEKQNEYLKMAKEWDSKPPTNNVHFHLITDRYYDVTILNHYWLTSLKNQGSRYENEKGQKYNPVEVSKPSSKGWQGMSSYLTKYVSKNDAAMRGPLWNCNAYVSAFATSVLKATDMSKYLPPIQMEEDSDLILCSIEKSKKVLKNGAIVWKCLRSKNRVYIDKAKGLAIYYFNKLTQGLKNALHPLFEFNRQTALGLSPTPFFMCN